MAILRKQVGQDETWVFPYEGRPLGRIKAAWGKACRRAGIKCRWHDLRHTWASWHVQRGTPLNVLQELGGWATYAMVQRYAHLSPEHLRKWVNATKPRHRTAKK
jgi:integrase